MNHIGHYFGLSKQTEILIFILFGITLTFFDNSLSNLNTNLQKVWDLKIDKVKIPSINQAYLKYLLCVVILIRTCLLHLYLAFSLVTIWPVFFEDRPVLLLPWLSLAAIKNIATSVMVFMIGLYSCFAYDMWNTPICYEFIIAMFIEHAPSYYIWYLVLGFYNRLKRMYKPLNPIRYPCNSEINLRRRKVRSMADSLLSKYHSIEEDRHLISVSTIENLVQSLSTNSNNLKPSRSLDSMMANKGEIEKDGSKYSFSDAQSDETDLDSSDKKVKLQQTQTHTAKIFKKKCESSCNGMSETKSLNDIRSEIGSTPFQTKFQDMIVSMNSLKQIETKKNISNSVSNKDNTWNHTSNISEIEIAGILNYSSMSLLPLISKDNLIPEGQCSKIKSVSEIDKLLAIQKYSRPEMLDFSCQVSTISKKFLNLQLLTTK